MFEKFFSFKLVLRVLVCVFLVWVTLSTSGFLSFCSISLFALNLIQGCRDYFLEKTDELQQHYATNIRRLQLEKSCSDYVATQISDGICVIQKNEIIYANSVAEQILRNSEYRTSILEAVPRSMPTELTVQEGGRKRHYVLQATLLSESIPEYHHDRLAAAQQVLVLAQDVTLVKESQEAKEHFLGALSHEIKTPVTSLTLAIRLLERMSQSQKSDSFQIFQTTSLVKTCVEEVDRLRKLLDDFMNVAHLDTLGQKIESKKIDFIKLVRNTVQNFYAAANDRGITLNWGVVSGEKCLLIWLDPAKMTWAISNLLVNAIRHTQRGGHVDAWIEVFEDRVEVRVCDSGFGIEPHRIDKIFEKFSTYYDIRVARTGTAGIGLCIAREIISAHGGRIWVSSKLGLGSQFCFNIPFYTENKNLERRSESDPLTMHQESSSKGNNSGTSACGG